jgi:hypothetical protein
MGMLDAYYNTITKALIDKVDAKKLGALKASRWAQRNAMGSVASYAGVGAAIGGAYGLISSDTSVLGGAMKGAAIGVGAHAARAALHLNKGLKNFEKGILTDVNKSRGLTEDLDLGLEGTTPTGTELLGRMSRLSPGSVKAGDMEATFGKVANSNQYIDGHYRTLAHPALGKNYSDAIDSYAKQIDQFRASTDKWDNLTDVESPLKGFFGEAKGDSDKLMNWQPGPGPANVSPLWGLGSNPSSSGRASVIRRGGNGDRGRRGGKMSDTYQMLPD